VGWVVGRWPGFQDDQVGVLPARDQQEGNFGGGEAGAGLCQRARLGVFEGGVLRVFLLHLPDEFGQSVLDLPLFVEDLAHLVRVALIGRFVLLLGETGIEFPQLPPESGLLCP
jgi:hypothetical protein